MGLRGRANIFGSSGPKEEGAEGGGTLGLSQPVYKFLHVDHDRKHFALEWRNYSALRNRST